jgi:3-deoxy-D-manno-octulosonic-acid transferase|tara:strand:- start:2364 stop:3191 length:828 start_codon:yes stop_codon:yes gene_type:complete
MIMQTSKQCKLILLNCRISKKSFNKWKIIKRTFKKILDKFDIILAQGKTTLGYLEYFKLKNIKQIGNIKFIQSKKNNPNIIQIDNGHNKWAAMSVHFKEYSSVIKTHLELSEIENKITTFIIPRHLNRIDDLEKIISNNKIKYQKISQNNEISNFSGIVIIDQFGLADDIFEKVKTVFMGGSLFNHGGQNPIEPLRYECKILTGKYINNFEEIYEDLVTKDLVKIVNNQNELKDKLLKICIKNKNSQNTKSKINLINLSDKVYNDTIKFLNNYIN